MKNHLKNTVILICMAGLILLLAGCGQEQNPTPHAQVPEVPEITTPSPLPPVEQNSAATPEDNQEQTPAEPEPDLSAGPAATPTASEPARTQPDQYQTNPVPAGKPEPVEPQNSTSTTMELTCTLSVSCSTILNNLDKLAANKQELVPADGIIFPATTVIFYEGENLGNVLQREMKQNKIHFEFSRTPVYNSMYIEGINNLYEFDCGELSGWEYKVNDWFPNYGCSRYQLKDGDVVEFLYTCDLGRDIGGYNNIIEE